MGTRTFHRDDVLALAGLMALHAVFVGILMHAMRPPVATQAGSETALQVVFLPTRRPAAMPSRPAPGKRPMQAVPAAPGPQGADRPATRMAAQPMPNPDAVDAGRSPAPMQATLIEQTSAAAARVAPIEFAATDVLGDRRARLPGRAGGRFRMHERLSPEQVVARVGKLFGGMSASEVRAAVCARNRQNLVNAAAGGGLELQVELETRRRYCAP